MNNKIGNLLDLLLAAVLVLVYKNKKENMQLVDSTSHQAEKVPKLLETLRQEIRTGRPANTSSKYSSDTIPRYTY